LTEVRPLVNLNFYSAAASHATRSSDEKAVCPSVCPFVCLSVKRVHCDKTEERSVQIFIPNERSFSLVFWKKSLVGATLLPEILDQPALFGAKSPIFSRYSLVASQL